MLLLCSYCWFLYLGLPWSNAKTLHHDRGGTSSHIWGSGCLHPLTWGYVTLLDSNCVDWLVYSLKKCLTVGASFKHADLLMKLTEGTGPDGTVAQIGQIVIDWVCMHIIYVGVYLGSVIFQYFQCRLVKTFLFPAARSECLQRLLQQPACS